MIDSAAPALTRRFWRTGLLVLLWGAALFASCKSATQVQLIVRTNVEYRPGVNVAIWAGSRGDGAAVPVATSAEPWLTDGLLGDLVITPRSTNDDPLVLRVSMGLGRDASTCSDTDARGCIVAKRKLRFVPHAGLRVPIVMHLACQDVVCDESSTCNYLGKCVSAEVDPNACSTPAGCALPGDETVSGTLPGIPEASTVPDQGTQDAMTDQVSFPDALSDGGAALRARIAAGLAHTCALLDLGAVKCWGNNVLGQLGIGDTARRGDLPNQMGALLPAVQLGAGRSALSVAAGRFFSCARLDNGQLKCWGDNAAGQLGLGDAQYRGDQPGELGDNLPQADLGPGNVVDVVAGAYHVCARLDTNLVKCWGQNSAFGTLGLGDAVARGDLPNQMGTNLPAVDLGSGTSVVQLAAGDGHTCALLGSAQVKCWGRNDYGQLGLGDAANRGSQPNQMGNNLPTVNLGPGRTAVAVAAGRYHSCARLDNGQLKCWGRNDLGQLGLGDVQSRGTLPQHMGAALPPVDVGAGRTVVALTGGEFFSCALLDSGQVKCWGQANDGQLGNGSVATVGTLAGHMGDGLAVADLGKREVLEIAAGERHACVTLLGTGPGPFVRCWGLNNAGALGLGDNLTRGDEPGEMGANLSDVSLY